MTRDKSDIGTSIAIWNTENNTLIEMGCWNDWWSEHAEVVLELTPKQFKQIFPKQKLPRKGSIKWVELRLYIPGEG